MENSKVSEIKVTYVSKVNLSEAPKITSSEDAQKLLFLSYDKDQIEMREEFKVMLLNSANKVKAIVSIATGTVSGCLVDAKMIFAIAVKTLSPSIIVCHNHPSGNMTPSKADIDITQKIKRAGHVLDVTVLDHIILSPDPKKYYSFGDEGMI